MRKESDFVLRVDLFSVDKLILLSLFLLASLPFSQVFFVRVGSMTLDSFELIYILIGFMLVLKILAGGKVRKTMFPFLSFVIAVFAYFFISTGHYSVFPHDFFAQLRLNYFQFAIATVILITPVKLKNRTYLDVLCIAGLISAFLNLTIYLFMPNVLEKMLSYSPELIKLVTTRGFWPNSTLTFFAIFSVFLPWNRKGALSIFRYISLIITSVALFFTFNRTMQLGAILFFVGCLLLEKRRKASPRSSLRILTGVLIIACVISAIALATPLAREQLNKRYPLSKSNIQEIYKVSVVNQRLNLYAQYLSSIKQHFPVGQGLGKPFSIRQDGLGVFVTDISFMEFLLPFGVLGLVIFFSFIAALFKLVLRYKTETNTLEGRLVILLLFLTLLVSLNYEIYVRGNFVIFITMLIVTLRNDQQEVKGT